MNRREILRDLSSISLVGPLAAAESLRQTISTALVGGGAADQREAIVADYARTFYLSPAEILLRDLLADMSLISEEIDAAPSRDLAPLRRAAGQLAAITAMTWSGLGLAAITERVSDTEAADHVSMFGWPEVRLRHTESYVYTALGETARAYAAQDRALILYGERAGARACSNAAAPCPMHDQGRG